MKTFFKLINLINLFVIFLILLSPITWIYIDWSFFWKYALSLIVVFFTLHIFSEALSSTIKKYDNTQKKGA